MTSQITTTVGDLVKTDEPLGRLLKRDLPVKAAYHLKRLAKLVVAELTTFNELRESYIKELGVEREPTPFERGTGVTGPLYEVLPTSPEWPEFQRRIATMFAMPVTIPIGPLDVSTLDGERFSALDLELLDPILTDGSTP